MSSEKIYTGYKATDKNIQCRGYQFVPGQWHKLDNDDPLELCKNGFHFCAQPSGPWSYYNEPGTRLWMIEAKDVVEGEPSPGTEQKHCSRWMRLVEEIVVGGDRNTGNFNTGNFNTGNFNTGDHNTGDHNTGHYNTGHRNTGDSNTGYHNTGDSNTGYHNTGYGNTGDCNTGSRNTGDCNTGKACVGNHWSGLLCFGSAPAMFLGRVVDGFSQDAFNKNFANAAITFMMTIKSPGGPNFKLIEHIPGYDENLAKAYVEAYINATK